MYIYEERERETREKEKMGNMKRATCSGRDFNSEKVCGLAFS